LQTQIKDARCGLDKKGGKRHVGAHKNRKTKASSANLVAVDNTQPITQVPHENQLTQIGKTIKNVWQSSREFVLGNRQLLQGMNGSYFGRDGSSQVILIDF